MNFKSRILNCIKDEEFPEYSEIIKVYPHFYYNTDRQVRFEETFVFILLGKTNLYTALGFTIH